ncbi:hypothetical protein E8E11_009815 [Didymella keratinophila]|nr:hypothetical protein E8E11_009815 [Didymella keratinophila]
MTSSAEKIAQALREAEVKANYVFYYAYLSPKNGKSAMDPETAEELPKRILLQTGEKNYGVHIGRVRTSIVESDPQPRHLSPNFYYPQEDALRAFCEEHPETKWNIVHPFAIIGATEHASMNTFMSFDIYAAVQAQKGEPLKFGSDFASWQFEAAHSTARLTGYLSEWAVLEEQCANQAFNARDGAGGKDLSLGYGPPTQLRYRFRLADWASDLSARKAWEEIMAKSNGKLTENPWDGDLKDFFMGDFAYLPFGTPSMNKARRCGFCGLADTLESVFEMFQEMEKLGTLPPMVVDAARPQI